MFKESFDNSNGEKFHIKLIENQDIEGCLDFIRKTYYIQEPVSKFFKFSESPETMDFLQKRNRKRMEEGVSLLATVGEKVVAVLVNEIIIKGETVIHKDIPSPADKYKGFIDYLNTKVDIFDVYPNVDKYFKLCLGSTAKSYQNLGLVTALEQESRILAKRLDCKLTVTQCSSLFGAKLALKLGWTKIYELKYVDYKVDGKQVVCPEWPHESLTLFALNVSITKSKY